MNGKKSVKSSQGSGDGKKYKKQPRYKFLEMVLSDIFKDLSLFEGYGLYFMLLKLKQNLPFAVFEEICWRLAGNEAAQNSNGRQ